MGTRFNGDISPIVSLVTLIPAYPDVSTITRLSLSDRLEYSAGQIAHLLQHGRLKENH